VDREILEVVLVRVLLGRVLVVTRGVALGVLYVRYFGVK
jgi:hypothetical protein